MKKEFISASKLSPREVQQILMEKIEEERSKILDKKEDEAILDKISLVPGKFNVVSLFSGAGGLDLGLEMSGIDAVYGRDFTDKISQKKQTYNENREKSIFNFVYSNDIFVEANETYLDNFPATVVKQNKDIRQVASFPNCQIMLGGFPCPGFSAAGPRLIDDPRNFLYIHYIRALLEAQPEFFVAENVKGIMTLANGEVFKQVVEDFASAGYDIQAYLVNARDYGVPQLRERVIIVGTHIEKVQKKYDWTYKLPDSSHGEGENKKSFVTLRDAIGDLPEDPDDVFVSDFSSMYMSRNRKKNWNDQSFTIQASGRQAPIWPGGEPMKKIGKDEWEFSGDVNRRVSVREAARIQTFPDWFEFSSGQNFSTQKNNRLNKQYQQIGNAVPVELARSVLAPIAEFLNNHPELAE